MESYQQRVIDEKNALGIKIEKLDEFFETSTFLDLVTIEQENLLDQHYFMVGYYEMLGKRIGTFKEV